MTTVGAQTDAVGERLARRAEPAYSHPWAGIRTDHILEELANLPSRRSMQAPRAHFCRNLIDVVDWARRSGYGRGVRFSTTLQQAIIGRGAEDRGDRKANLAHGETSLRRYLKVLKELGMLDFGARQRDDGGDAGLWVTLTRPAWAATLSDASARSSAGLSNGPAVGVRCELRWRTEGRRERQERRVRPRRRRKDVPARFELEWHDGPLSFSPKETGDPLRRTPGFGPKGPSPVSDESHRCVRAGAGLDAQGPPGSAAAAQASAWHRFVQAVGNDETAPAAWERGGREASLASVDAAADAAAAGAPGVALCLALFEIVLCRPSWPLDDGQRAVLGRVLEGLDRYGGFGRRSAGAGVRAAGERLVSQRERELWGKPAVGSLAYFLPELEATWKLWRHQDRHRKGSCPGGCRYDRPALGRRPGDWRQRGPR